MKKRILSSKKAERFRKEAEKERKNRWKYGILFAALAVIGLIVSTAVAVYQGTLDQESVSQDQQQLAPTNKSDLRTSTGQAETTARPSSATDKKRQQP